MAAAALMVGDESIEGAEVFGEVVEGHEVTPCKAIHRRPPPSHHPRSHEWSGVAHASSTQCNLACKLRPSLPHLQLRSSRCHPLARATPGRPLALDIHVWDARSNHYFADAHVKASGLQRFM